MILATPPGFNPGMVATELALAAFLRRHGWWAQTEFYQLVRLADRLRDLPPGERAALERRADSGITARPALEHYEAIVTSDVILYWADFLHMAQYLRALQQVVVNHELRSGERSPAQIVNRLFLLAEADDAALRRTVSFGTNLLFNTLRDEADPAYAVPLRRLLGLAKRVWVRDALSAARVAHLRGDYAQGYFGVDCAQLLTRADVLGSAAAKRTGRARPGARLLRARRRRARPAARAGGHACGRCRPAAAPAALGRCARVPGAAPDALAGALEPTGRELLAEVARASLVVTDTYHLAVTAWSLGVPAVAAFAGHTSAEKDVSSGPAFHWRDKREVFFSQYDALDFLVRPEELADGARFARRAAHIAETVRDGSLCAMISARIRRHGERIEAELAAEMAGLLAYDRLNDTSPRIPRLW